MFDYVAIMLLLSNSHQHLLSDQLYPHCKITSFIATYEKNSVQQEIVFILLQPALSSMDEEYRCSYMFLPFEK
jgi:hypothetical protein